MRLRWVVSPIVALVWMSIGTACGDDDAPARSGTADAGLDATGDASSRLEPDEASAPEAASSCPGTAAAPALSGTCATCTSANCCAQASACFVGGSCQKVIDCIDNCTRGAIPDGGVPPEDDPDAGATDGDGGDKDAGDGDADAGDGDADPVDPVQACIDTCAAPLAAEVEALSALSDCQAMNCAEACPAE